MLLSSTDTGEIRKIIIEINIRIGLILILGKVADQVAMCHVISAEEPKIIRKKILDENTSGN